ncbi:MAG: CvpA family protein, partial [Candidatus Paceibacterota bacterium]
MSLIDIIILVPLLFLGFRGFKNGLVREIFGLVGLVLAIFFSFQYMAEFATLIREQLYTKSPYVPYFSFGILFLLVLLFVQVIIFFTESLLKIAFLSLPNRLLGSLFSAFKAALVISIILLLFSGFALPDEETRSD